VLARACKFESCSGHFSQSQYSYNEDTGFFVSQPLLNDFFLFYLLLLSNVRDCIRLLTSIREDTSSFVLKQ
jgi:hypothetical protein